MSALEAEPQVEEVRAAPRRRRRVPNGDQAPPQALVRYQPTLRPTVSVPTVDELNALRQMMDVVAKTEFVPQSLRGRPDAALAAVLYGRELGFLPMTSLKYIQVIQGQPTVAPRAMAAMIRRAGHLLQIRETTETRCVIYGKRRDTGEDVEVEWTIDRARRAGLVKEGSGWAKYPEDMLFARTMGTIGRRLFEDVVLGSYTPEEFDQSREVIETQPLPPRPTGAQTASAIVETAAPALAESPAIKDSTASTSTASDKSSSTPPTPAAVEPEGLFEAETPPEPATPAVGLGKLRVQVRDLAIKTVVAFNTLKHPGIQFTERQIQVATDMTLHKRLKQMDDTIDKFENATVRHLTDLREYLTARLEAIAKEQK